MPDDTTPYAETLLVVANDAARAVSTRLVRFLTVAAYVAITIASTTDEKLVLGSVVTLPLLNTQIPISSGPFAFYFVAPWLIVVLHCDLLLQLSVLESKFSRFQKTSKQLPDDQSLRLRERVANLYYAQVLVGERRTWLQSALSMMIIISSVIWLPLMLLLWIQGRFLALHDSTFTWSQLIAIIIDVFLILALWRGFAATHDQPQVQPGRWRPALRRLGSVPSILVYLTCTCAVVFGVYVAKIPRDQQAFGPRLSDWVIQRNLNLQEKILTANLSPAVINALSDGNDVKQVDQELEKLSPLNCLQGRDLRYANFFHAVLPKLDLRSARDANSGQLLRVTQLQGADFSWAQMQHVLLDDADLQDAKFVGAGLQGGSLQSAQLRDANLSMAKLQEARLGRANLQCAQITGAALQGADLAEADLHDADLSNAQLQGANLQRANLQGADLSGAALQGADLSEAHLEGANLWGAQLQGAVLQGTFVLGADFEGANLDSGVLPEERQTLGTASQPEMPDTTLDRCGDRQAAVLRQRDHFSCPQHPPYTRERANVTFSNESLRMETLAKLACWDAYIARGLSWHVLYNAGYPGRKSLAQALLAAAKENGRCRGVELLPEAMKEDLEHFAETKGIVRFKSQSGKNLNKQTRQ